MTWQTFPVATVSILAVLTLWMSVLWSWHKKDDDNFDLRWLIINMDSGMVSLSKIGQLTALIVSTWGFAVLVERGQITEFFFIGYMGTWASANLASKWLDNKKEKL